MYYISAVKLFINLLYELEGSVLLGHNAASLGDWCGVWRPCSGLYPRHLSSSDIVLCPKRTKSCIV